jgi:hypothetical protein
MRMSDNRALARTAASQYGLLTLAQQRAGGLSPQTVRNRRVTGRYLRLARGVDAIAGTPLSWHQTTMAALLAAGEAANVSHRSAIHAWGIGTFDEVLDLAVPYRRAPVVPGATVHRSLDLVEGDVVVLDGFRVSTVPRTLVDVGAVLPTWLVEVLVERAIGRSMTSSSELREILERVAKRGRRGVGALRTVLDERALGDQLTESEIEEIFGRVCRQIGVAPPQTQVPVTIGGRDYRLDFAYPEQKVAIEINGFTVHTRRHVFENDHERRNALIAAGWVVPEFTRRQLLRSCAHIRQTLLAVL